MNKKIAIHIGYGKTGTTSLQKYFSNSKSVNYLGKKITKGKVINNEINQICDSVIYENDSDFYLNKSSRKEILNKFLVPNKINLLSYEGFTQSLALNYFRNLDEIFKRLYALFENNEIKIIMVIRNHTEMLYSHYNQFRSFLFSNGLTYDDLSKSLKNNTDNKFLDQFMYSKVKKKLEFYFGNNIEILLYEDLVSNEILFIKNFFRSIGIKELKEDKIDLVLPKLNVSSYKYTYFQRIKLLLKKVKDQKNYFDFKNFFKKLNIAKQIIFFKKPELKYINKNEFQKLKFNIKNYYKEDTEKLEKIKLEYNFRKNDYI